VSAAPVVVAGAGPAGLAAGLALARSGRRVVLVERDDAVGGLARTVERDGYRFDIGGHRFFTRVPEVQALWDELLGADMLVRRRRSRILFNGRYFDYPLTASSALAGLGVAEGVRILASYARARLAPIRPERSFADWVTNRFGRRLFEAFFRSYTEKVWGRPCESIGAEWAAQRIRGLSLRAALADMLRRGRGGHRTLATEFLYPRLGPGMLWERMRAEVERRGGRVLLGTSLASLRVAGGRIEAVEVVGRGTREWIPAAHLVSTIPLRDLAAALSTALTPAEREAARALRYRDFIQVAVVLEGEEPFPDTWLYLHDHAISCGRIQNFRAWSPELVPQPDRCCLGLEYFCDTGDALWTRSDEALGELAAADLARLGFADRSRIVTSHVVRMRGAYPVYDDGFAERVAVLRGALSRIGNLGVAGRSGMHRYNNMDHSMLTGVLAARNVLGERNDTWAVAGEDDHLEPESTSIRARP